MDKPLDLLFCFAVTHEAGPFRSWARPRNGIEIFLTGIGVENARRSLRRRLENGPRPALIVSTGLAGGLASDLKSGDIVFAERAFEGTLDHPFANAVRRFRSGRFYCAHHVLDAHEKHRIHAESSADVVEMESAAVEEVAREFGLDALFVRVVLDPVDQELPLDFNAVSDSQMRVRVERILPKLIARPSRIPKLLQFKRQVDQCSQILAEALRDCVTVSACDQFPASSSSTSQSR